MAQSRSYTERRERTTEETRRGVTIAALDHPDHWRARWSRHGLRRLLLPVVRAGSVRSVPIWRDWQEPGPRRWLRRLRHAARPACAAVPGVHRRDLFHLWRATARGPAVPMPAPGWHVLLRVRYRTTFVRSTDRGPRGPRLCGPPVDAAVCRRSAARNPPDVPVHADRLAQRPFLSGAVDRQWCAPRSDRRPCRSYEGGCRAVPGALRRALGALASSRQPAAGSAPHLPRRLSRNP